MMKTIQLYIGDVLDDNKLKTLIEVIKAMYNYKANDFKVSKQKNDTLISFVVNN